MDASETGSQLRSPIVNNVDIQTPELHVRTLTLHPQLTEDHVIVSPEHRWCQAIVVLSGKGRQVFSNESAEVEPGVVVMLPPGHVYSFHPRPNQRAACLVVAFQLKRELIPHRRICAICRGELTQTREQLGRLLRMQAKGSGLADWEGATVVLELVIRLLRASGWIDRAPAPATQERESPMRRMLQAMDLESPLKQVVQRSGYQRDHLNRLVKKETGLTLGQFRAKRRLAKAKELLALGIKVGDVAHRVGLPDPSYFARWFRQQTGQSPSQWLSAGRHGAPVGFASSYGSENSSPGEGWRVRAAG